MHIVFFFQAEDGIRDADVTGVQTCALPIFPAARFANALLDNIAGFSGHNSARAQEDDITSSSSTFSRTLRSQEEFNPCDAESFKPWKQALQCRPANAAATLGVMIGTPARTPAPHTTHTRPARPAPTWPQKGCITFPLRIAYP